MKIRINKKLMVPFAVSGIMLIVLLIGCGLFECYSILINNILAVLVLIYSVLLVYRYRANIGLLLMFFCILYTNYSIVVGVYLFPEIRGSLYSQFENIVIYGRGVFSLYAFVSFLYICSLFYEPKRFDNEAFWKVFNPNSIIKFACLIAYIFTFINEFSFSFGRRGDSSVLEEYKVVFFIAGSLFSKQDSMKDRVMWTVAVVTSSVIVFVSGNRVSSLNGLIVLMWVWYGKYLNLKKIIILSAILAIIMTFIGQTRGSYVGGISINDSLLKLWKEKLTTDTFIYAYVPSLASEALIDRFTLAEKIEILLGNVKYIFLGSNWSVAGLLTEVTSKYYAHSAGYIAATQFDLWFRSFGAIITASLTQIQLYYSSVKKSLKHSIAPIIQIGMVSFVFRWYVYNYMALFRLDLLLVVMYLMLFFANRLARIR